MNKKYVISFAISSAFIITFSVIIFMIMLPQSIDTKTVDRYMDINKEEYKFVQTKNISEDSLSYQYNVTSEDIENFKVTNQYKMGNVNPFYGE
ncbi:MAG: hypothetical protein Q4D02_06750 [Clostridia bacterium]|nr:hypothetical protein [Clostridia bacterium]